MRLGQLTRQLDIDATVVVNFLKKEGVDIENHPNTKLDDNLVELVFHKFPKQDEVDEIEKPIDDDVKEELADSSVSDMESNEEIEIPTEVIEEITSQVPEETVPTLHEQPQLTPSSTDEVKKSDEDEVEIITLPKEEVEKLVETGEIVSDIEAEAATLSEAEIIKAKFTTLDGLNVKGKIDLPYDARREKKELARKAQAEIQKEKSNAGKTIDGVHPNKRAKDEGEKMKNDLLKQETEAINRLERKRIKAEKEAAKAKKNSESKKKTKKKSKKTKEKILSPEELKKKAAREKRQKAKEKANAPAASRNFWQKIWDAIK